MIRRWTESGYHQPYYCSCSGINAGMVEKIYSTVNTLWTARHGEDIVMSRQPHWFRTWTESPLRVASQRSNQLGQRVRPAGEKLAGRLNCHIPPFLNGTRHHCLATRHFHQAREKHDNQSALSELSMRWACPPGCLEQIKTAHQDGLTTAPTFFRELNAFLIMLKFSDSYETYRICSQQYLQSIWIVFGCMGCWGVGWGVPNPSRRTHDGFTTDQDWPGQTHLSVCNLMMLEYSDSYETYRICSQQYLHSIWIVFGCMGRWGVGWGVPNPSRRTHDGPGQMHLSTYLMMLEYSDSYETYRICSQQYLHSIWIVFGCMGCWGVGWGCQHRPDGPATDPNGNFLSPQTWL